MTYLIIGAVAALVTAGFYFKKDETLAFLKSAWLWAAAVAVAAAQAIGAIDLTNLF